MGNRKDTEKAPEIPYSGALKKLFEVISDANFPCNDSDVNIGRKYRVQQRISIPRQWYLEVFKLPKDAGFGLRVAVNAAIPPATDPVFVTLTNVTVTDVKVNGANIFVWVENSSGSVANLVFKSEEDKFQARLFTETLAEVEESLKEFHEGPLLGPQDIRDLNGDFRRVAKVLKVILSVLQDVNKQSIQKANKVDASRTRRRNVTISAVVPAPSRDKGKGKNPVTKSADVPSVLGDVGGGAKEGPGGIVPDVPAEQGVSSGQLPTGETLAAQTPAAKKTRMKISPRNRRAKPAEETPHSPETRRVLELQFRQACLKEEAPAIPKMPLKKKERLHQHPRKTAQGKQIDFEDRRDELQQFKDRVKPIFPFGPETVHMVPVEQMDFAPKESKYRPFHESLSKSLLEIFLTALHPQKQTLTLMPDCEEKPRSFEDVKDRKFFIINGQHSWAAAKMLIENPYASDELKNQYKTWKCHFVWTKNMPLLSELSLRINNTNQHRWNSPEYLLHIQYARDLWITYNRPEARGTSSKKYKVNTLP